MSQVDGLLPIVIPVYVSNLGCPHRCVFCDQTQYSKPIPPEDIREFALRFISNCRMPQERNHILAFYGGSFTGIEEVLFNSYINAGKRLIKEGLIHGLKASTRPDMVDEETLSKLRQAGFIELEIGAQSMDDGVLSTSMRGHTADSTRKAATLIKASGLKLGIQIMPGLPGEDKESFIRTVNAVCEIKPDTTRIYPTVVVKETKLESMYGDGIFKPLSLDAAVRMALYAYIRFKIAGAAILRIGVPVEGLDVVAGPVHPSFGFLVKSHAYKLMVQKALDSFNIEGLSDSGMNRDVVVNVNPHDLQELIGYKRENITEFCFGYTSDSSLPRGQIIVRFGKESACFNFEDILNHII
jgi:histone acetyltransferase (RNA polymerase elongator complex component)